MGAMGEALELLMEFAKENSMLGGKGQQALSMQEFLDRKLREDVRPSTKVVKLLVEEFYGGIYGQAIMNMWEEVYGGI